MVSLEGTKVYKQHAFLVLLYVFSFLPQTDGYFIKTGVKVLDVHVFVLNETDQTVLRLL